MRQGLVLALSLFVSTILVGCTNRTDETHLVDEGFAIKPCWHVENWHQPGLYTRLGAPVQGEQVELFGHDSGRTLAFEHANLTIPGPLISLREVRQTAPAGLIHELLRISLEAADSDGRVWLSAITGLQDSPDEVEELSRSFLANTTTTSDDLIRRWASELAASRTRSDEFPPATHHADYSGPGARGDSFEYNITIEPTLRLAELADELSRATTPQSGQVRPWHMVWDWRSEGPYPYGAGSWAYEFRVATRVVAAELHGLLFLVQVGATDLTFVYTDGDPGFLASPRENNTAGEAWVRDGFSLLGLPDPSFKRFVGGGRTGESIEGKCGS